MHAADTSWLYALFRPEDDHHRRAFAEAQDPTPVLVNPIILVEFLDLVRSRHGATAAAACYEGLMQTPTMRHMPAPKPGALARAAARHPRNSWHDASAIATALDESAGLRTFDKDQRKAFDALR